MMNGIWVGLMLLSVVIAAFNGRLSEVAQAVPEQAKFSVELAIGLVGIMVFWLGIMKIAEQSGLIQAIAKKARPLTSWLFPEVPTDHPAMGAMLLNISANMLGLANAATPFGLRAMHELQTLNPEKAVATNAMCMFLAINTSSVQLLPMTAIAFLAANGNNHPTEIVLPTLLATSASTIVAIMAAKFFELKQNRRRFDDKPSVDQSPVI